MTEGLNRTDFFVLEYFGGVGPDYQWGIRLKSAKSGMGKSRYRSRPGERE